MGFRSDSFGSRSLASVLHLVLFSFTVFPFPVLIGATVVTQVPMQEPFQFPSQTIICRCSDPHIKCQSVCL